MLYLALAIVKFMRYLRMIHEYKKNQVEIMVLAKELEENNKNKISRNHQQSDYITICKSNR